MTLRQTIPHTSENGQACFHCGENMKGIKEVIFDSHAFCCDGCARVYDILSEGELKDYYEIVEKPGIRYDAARFERKYAFLDQVELIKPFIDFQEGNLTKVSFFIPQMHCSSCIWLLENLYRLETGIKVSQVNFSVKKVYITFDHEKVSFRQLVELMARIGYAPELSSDQYAKKKIQKSIYMQLGIAGFCFGNIMLMSFPEYLDETKTLDEEFSLFFGYANFILSLPVMFYAGKDYLISSWKSLRIKQLNIDVPIALGMIALFCWSSWEIFMHTGPGYFDSLAGLIFFLLIGKWYQGKTYETLSYERDYKAYFPLAVSRILNDTEEEVSIQILVKGDVIRIRNHEIIPADCILLEGEARIDYSFVTGESDPVHKEKGSLLYAGGRQIGSSVLLEVKHAVDQSYLTQLWNQRADKQGSQQMRRQVDKISKYFTIGVLGIALITGVFWYFIDASQLIYIVSTVLIIACPCALALSVPFTFGNSTRILGRLGYYLKSSDSLEDLAQIDSIVFDKTGTITQHNKMELRFEGADLAEDELRAVKALSSQSLHPLSLAISRSLDVKPAPLKGFEEKTGQGISAFILGQHYQMGAASWLIPDQSHEVPDASRTYLSISGKLRGCYVLNKGYRQHIAELIEDLQNNYSLHLLSGDNAAERSKLGEWFQNESHMHFEQKPEDKLHYISALQNKGHNVMMVGDGLNDAGALLQSNIGLAVSDDVYGFSPSCDLIVRGDALPLLDRVLKFSRQSGVVVRLSFIFSLLYNAIGMFFAVQGILTPVIAAILMPLSSVTIIAFTTLSTSLLAKGQFKPMTKS